MKVPVGIFFPEGFLPEKRPGWQHSGCLQPSVYTQLAEALQVCVYTHLTHLNTALQKAKGGGTKVRGWWRHCLILYWFFWPATDSSKPKPKAVRQCQISAQCWWLVTLLTRAGPTAQVSLRGLMPPLKGLIIWHFPTRRQPEALTRNPRGHAINLPFLCIHLHLRHWLQENHGLANLIS